MEDIVAARVRDHSGKWYGFMTWGRVVDRIDCSWLEEVVLANARKRAIPEVAEVRICESLSEVAGCLSVHLTNRGGKTGKNEFEQGTFQCIFSARSVERRADLIF